jgi:glucose-1-phosphate thymidylyltransferase
MSINIKGIILAGGMGKRMRPLSNIISKHLMPVYDKPMIFYSLSVLIYSGVKNILLITDFEQQKIF